MKSLIRSLAFVIVLSHSALDAADDSYFTDWETIERMEYDMNLNNDSGRRQFVHEGKKVVNGESWEHISVLNSTEILGAMPPEVHFERVTDKGLIAFDPHTEIEILVCPAPFVDGHSWETDFGSVQYTVRCSIEPSKQIGAQRYQNLAKIIQASKDGRATITTWYAKGIGMVAREMQIAKWHEEIVLAKIVARKANSRP